jgi:hypothetical protein
VRREGGEGWIGQALTSFSAGTGPMRLSMLLLIEETLALASPPGRLAFRSPNLRKTRRLQ